MFKFNSSLPIKCKAGHFADYELLIHFLFIVMC